ncbi:hypothetical protein QYF61_027864 [Mycteria americana]|uniref:Uncharacterized protein n=1 Tax=Mycteria americana TaxID=33587 RepID=A0AAN7MX72_MYCAM|nr:hypothetical protein QYF61_027864 [Mycteria americana]
MQLLERSATTIAGDSERSSQRPEHLTYYTQVKASYLPDTPTAFLYKCSGKKTSGCISADKSVHCNSSNRKHPAGGQKEQRHLVLRSGRENGKALYLFAKQPQFPQLLLISLVLQTLPQLRCPSLDTLQHLNVSLVARGPKLNTVFEGDDHCPTPAGHAISDTSQDAIGFLGHLGTLLAHIQAAVNHHPQVLLCLAAFQPLFPKPVALHGVAVAQLQDLALGLVESHTTGPSPWIQPVQIPLQSLPPLKQINTPTQLGVICKLTEGALDPLIQIIDKDIKQDWPQHRALGDTACDRPPIGFNSIHHRSLGPAIQPVLYPAKSTPVQATSRQFLQENAVGNGVKGFTKV